ncbi:MAG: hydrogenase maturation nickel metallochaperone HypA, partial [Erysipelotrichaceae bacterium]|nr:hydrogenase maturation nickel metallochaperone HypA [Erysipelotrichaceae bacterium]
MHELSIVTHVAKTLDELAQESNLAKIGSVTLEVGEVSGIITDYFIDCWN